MTDQPSGRVNDFDSIADIYDQLVDWAPYEEWVRDLERRLRAHGLPRRAWILDAACGTGLSTLPWLERGYRVVGVDESEPMLRMARERFAGEGYHVRVLRQSFLDMDPGRTFDLVLCMHSGLDYVLDEEELAGTFVSFRRCLRPGGLLAFDKCLDEPEFYHEDYSSTRPLSVGRAEFRYHWDRDERRMVQRCTVTRTGGEDPVHHEFIYHLQATAPDCLEDMLEEAGFICVEPPEQFSVEDPGAGIYRAV